ncbi:MAG: glycosyltransferase [Nitrospirae bacterium]|nr:glycosyltransferase [Nitrospirota bacterium]
MKTIKRTLRRLLIGLFGDDHPVVNAVRRVDWLIRHYVDRLRFFYHSLRFLNYSVAAPIDRYQAWQNVNRWNDRARNSLLERLGGTKGERPLISVIMPVYDPPADLLDAAIASVVGQVYEKWELCIADDCSSRSEIRSALDDWRSRDSRIKVTLLDQNVNISKATNRAVDMAEGEYVLFLDHDDLLTPDALGEVALYLVEHPETDVLYSDDDKITVDGRRFAPQFKPDWSPELLLSYMYFSHVFVVRRSCYESVGGMREGFEGSQDYDLALRVTERARDIGHVPKVLYHWRVLPGSTALSGAAKPQSFEAGRRAVQEALDRRGVNARVSRPEFAVKGGIGVFAHEFPDTGSRVSLLIPTKNNLRTLKACLESIEKTTYKDFEVVIIDNESDDPETLAYLRSIRHKVLRIPNPSGSFNFSAINNRAVQQIDSPYILFLNDDVEVRSPRWLSQMMGYAQLQGVGAVGAKLVFPDGRIQHAGIIHGLYHGMAGPAFKLSPEWDHGYLSYASVVRNYSAVTAACMVTPRRLFLDLGGFDEERYAVAYNDVDYCYRLVDRGSRCVFCPTAELTHYEGHSRGYRDNPAEVGEFRRTYHGRSDPWYSPYLSLENERFEIVPRRLAPEKCGAIPTLMTAFTLNWEGAPISQYELTVYLKKTGVIQPIVFCPQDGPLRKAYEEKGIPVHIEDHPLAQVNTLGKYERAIVGLSEKMVKWGVKLVYGNTLQTFYAIDAARLVDLPSIWNPRESEPWKTYFRQFGPEISERALSCFRLPYRVIFVSDATRDGYLPLDTHHNFTVIHNGIDRARLIESSGEWSREKSRAALGCNTDEVVILLLGTVCPRKGQHDLPEALLKLPSDLHEKIRCFIVGDRPGEYSYTLRKIVNILPSSLRDRVTIVQETSETACYYKAADIFVCTSRIESYPRVTLEAMAYGLPIITTPVYGIGEQVKEGINALFYTPGDASELAGRLAKLITDPDLRQLMADNSGHVLDALNNYEDMAQAYAEVFREAYVSGGHAK